MFSDKKIDNRTALVAAATTAAATTAAAATAAESVGTAAAGHTRPGPDQRRCACVSSISPMKIATCSISYRFPA